MIIIIIAWSTNNRQLFQNNFILWLDLIVCLDKCYIGFWMKLYRFYQIYFE